jgi:membrane protease subunit (stomatin/prohibitin family)
MTPTKSKPDAGTKIVPQDVYTGQDLYVPAFKIRIGWNKAKGQDDTREIVHDVLSLTYADSLTNIEQVVLASAPDHFGQYGVEINKISGLTISLPDEVQKAVDTRSEMSVLGVNYMQFQTGKAIDDAAKNPSGGAAGAGAGIGVGLGAGMGMGYAMGGQMSQGLGQPPTKSCPNCGSLIAISTAFCPNCGAKQTQPTGGQPVQGKQTFCSNCGSPLQAGAKFCPNCGNKV